MRELTLELSYIVVNPSLLGPGVVGWTSHNNILWRDNPCLFPPCRLLLVRQAVGYYHAFIWGGAGIE